MALIKATLLFQLLDQPGIMTNDYFGEEHDWPLVSEYHRDYKVLRQIASGAFGSVHCVQRRDTKVIQAAKYVKSSEEDLRREIDALLALRKSGFIVQFVAFYASEPPKLCQSVLVTEFLAGGDLIERTSSAVSVKSSIGINVKQICSYCQTALLVQNNQ